jgi:hypothetical protein
MRTPVPTIVRVGRVPGHANGDDACQGDLVCSGNQCVQNKGGGGGGEERT